MAGSRLKVDLDMEHEAQAVIHEHPPYGIDQRSDGIMMVRARRGPTVMPSILLASNWLSDGKNQISVPPCFLSFYTREKHRRVGGCAITVVCTGILG